MTRDPDYTAAHSAYATAARQAIIHGDELTIALADRAKLAFHRAKVTSMLRRLAVELGDAIVREQAAEFANGESGQPLTPS